MLDTLREEGEDVELDDIRKPGYGGTWAVESGGRNRASAVPVEVLLLRSTCSSLLEPTRKVKVSTTPSMTSWAMLSAAVCHADRDGKAEEIYIVVSGEMMAMYAANNICKGIMKYRPVWRRSTRWSYLQLRNVDNEKEMIEELAEKLGTQMILFRPAGQRCAARGNQQKDSHRMEPQVPQADAYRGLAKAIDDNKMFVIPNPLEIDRTGAAAARLWSTGISLHYESIRRRNHNDDHDQIHCSTEKADDVLAALMDAGFPAVTKYSVAAAASSAA